MNWLAAFGMAIASFGMVVVTALMLASRYERRMTLVLVLLGLITAGLKIWVIQQTPQWHDINPDSITYDLNAKAFVDHWLGMHVEGVGHKLRGLVAFNVAGMHGPEWDPDDALSYGLVIGSHEWLYTAYIAIWYFLTGATQDVVIATNAIWAAFLPAAAAGIAFSLGATRPMALAAAGLVLIDPSTGVNAAWLLKDTLAAFLSMATLWALLGYMRDGGGRRLVFAAFALSVLGGVRFVGFMGLVIAAGIVCLWLILKNRRLQALAILCTLLFAWSLQGVHSSVPHFFKSSVVVSAVGMPVKTFSQGVGVLKSSDGDASADETVQGWKQSFVESPVYAISRSIARTLFAPYPWVAFYSGLNWKSFVELYYPGALLWIVCLPGVMATVLVGLRSRDPAFWLLLLFLGSQFAAYTIWLGEWSTRQRVFALPAFFAMAVFGWVQLRGFVKNRVTKY